MNAERKALSDLFERLHGMGVTSVRLACRHCDGTGMVMFGPGECAIPCSRCDRTGILVPNGSTVLVILGEMMTVDTPGVSMSDVLTAAKAAGVY